MPEHDMITVTAFKWVPPFAAGQVRDHRVRWMLNEIGWDYEIDLIDPTVQTSSGYLAEQPFGQVPVLRETGRPAVFETGAIVLDLAERSGKLWPADRDAQAQVRSWVIAALNSVEPYLSNVAEVDFFTDDETLKRLRRPGAVAAATQRLGKLSASLGECKYLVGDAFTAADLMLASVLRVADHADLLAAYRNLSGYRARCLERPLSERRSLISAGTSRPTAPRTWAGIPRCSRTPQQTEPRLSKSECKGELIWSPQSTSSSRATASKR